MSFRCGWVALALLGCQDRSGASAATAGSSAPALTVASSSGAIEIRDGATITARVVPGQPCRATVDEHELIVGFGRSEVSARSLVSQFGTTRWTTEQHTNGTTLYRNALPVARIHARQLFDEAGSPVIRVLDSGDIVNGAGQVIRHARVDAPNRHVAIARATTPGQPASEPTIVTNTTDPVLAAMLTARETTAEIRALAACHFLLPENPPEPRAH